MSSIKKGVGNRKFYALPEDYALKSAKLRSQAVAKKEDSVKLIKYVDDNVIGKSTTFAGPFGRRKGRVIVIQLAIAYRYRLRDEPLVGLVLLNLLQLLAQSTKAKIS